MTEETEFGMFSKEGDRLVKELIDKICNLPKSMSDDEVFKTLKKEISTIGNNIKFEEIHDTMVREAIAVAIEKLTGKWFDPYRPINWN